MESKAISSYRVVSEGGFPRLQITINELRKIKEQYDPDAASWNNLLEKIARVIKEETDRRFRSETDPAGEKWTELKRPRHAIRGSKIWFTKHQILNKTGALRRSLATGRISLSRDTIFELGTQIPYAIYHQKGVKFVQKSGGIPKRAFLGVSKEMEVKIAKLIEKFEQKMVKDFGKKRMSGLWEDELTGKKISNKLRNFPRQKFSNKSSKYQLPGFE